MSGGPVVVLDAAVLFPARIRDILLRSAELGLFQARWSEQILAEVYRNLIATGKCSEQQASQLLAALKNAFEDAMVADFEHLTASMTNHPKDRHVLAAAVAAQAQVIVTSNLRDFPGATLAPHNVVAVSPDEFLCELFNKQPLTLSGIIVDLVRDLRRPTTTLEAELSTLEKQLPLFIHLVREQLELP